MLALSSDFPLLLLINRRQLQCARLDYALRDAQYVCARAKVGTDLISTVGPAILLKCLEAEDTFSS